MSTTPMRTAFLVSMAVALVVSAHVTAADGVPEKYRPTVQKGLEWLCQRGDLCREAGNEGAAIGALLSLQPVEQALI